MMQLLSEVPSWILVSALLLVGIIILSVVVWALKQGREVSFWPPRIGPRTGEAFQLSDDREKRRVQVNRIDGILDAINLSSRPRAVLMFNTGACVVLTEGTPRVTLGRSKDCDIVVEDSYYVSREHLQIECKMDIEGNKVIYKISDMDSKAGVTINGHQIKEETLSHGDNVEAGDIMFKFSLLAK